MSQKDPAKARFFAIQGVRISGTILTMLGIAVLAGKTDLPRLAGYVLAVVGLVDALIVPTLLARRWSSRKP